MEAAVLGDFLFLCIDGLFKTTLVYLKKKHLNFEKNERMVVKTIVLSSIK